jgi:hypothetical protein
MKERKFCYELISIYHHFAAWNTKSMIGICYTSVCHVIQHG